MFFHIDESGNTGNNLFDFEQPRLSYGVLSSTLNVDVLCQGIHKEILSIIDDDMIHANQLGVVGLREISKHLLAIQKKVKFDFDYYFIDKTTHALVVFFDAVFDAGLNEAVKWDVYWTPMRYLIIHKLTILFDEELLRESWRLCTIKRIERHEGDIVRLLSELKRRAELSILDERSKEIIIDAFDYGISNPLALDFGFPDQKMISPNAVGFQFVVSAIARRMRKKRRKEATSIVVDRQAQFNKAQVQTHYHQKLVSEGVRNASGEEKKFYINHPLFVNIDEDELVQKGLPDKDLTIAKSADSIGLQIVDVYLWITNKVLADQALPDELIRLWSSFSKRSLIDGISLEGMGARYENFEALLPQLDELTEEQWKFANESVEKHRQKVCDLKGLSKLG